MKERLIPKNTLKVLGVAALIAAGGFYEKHQERQTLALPSEHLLIHQEEDSFTVIDAHETYEFSGKFHYANRTRDYLAVGATQDNQCAVAVIQKDKPIITIYDNGVNPYRILNVNEYAVRYYSEHSGSITLKDYFYQDGITYNVYTVNFPPYEFEGGKC